MNKNVLKNAGVLLIALVMVLSTIVVAGTSSRDTFMDLEVTPLSDALLDIDDEMRVWNLDDDGDDGVMVDLEGYNKYEAELDNMLQTPEASIKAKITGTSNGEPFWMEMSIGPGFPCKAGKGVYPVGFDGAASGAPSIIAYFDDEIVYEETFETIDCIGNITEIGGKGVYPVGFDGAASGAPSIIWRPKPPETWSWVWVEESVSLIIDGLMVKYDVEPGEGSLEYASVYGAGIDEFTVLEHYAYEETIPDLNADGSLAWTDVSPGSTVTGSFTVENIGEPESELNWEIESYPSWGTFTFTPSSGINLKPEDGSITVEVEVIAPDEPNQPFEGDVKIVNTENSEDFCIIDVTLTTPRNRAVNTPFLNFLENHPILYQLLLRFLRL